MLDIFRGDLVREWFFTETAGVPTTLAGSPVAKAFVGSNTTGVTTGVTLSIDAGGITGSHRVEIDTSNQSVFIPGNRVTVKLSAGTVSGDSVVGCIVTVFTIEKVWDGRAFEGTAIGVANGALTLDALDTDAAAGDILRVFTASTGAGQQRTITDVTTGVATLDRNWVTNPTGTVVYRRYPSSLGLTAVEQAAATLAAATSTPIASEIIKVAGETLQGAGTVPDPWRPT